MELSGETFGGRFWPNLLHGELNRLEIDPQKLWWSSGQGRDACSSPNILTKENARVWSFFLLETSGIINLQVLRKFCTIRMCVKLWPFSSPKLGKLMGASLLLCIFRESGIRNYFLCPSFLVNMIVKIESNIFHSKYILYDSWGLWYKRYISIWKINSAFSMSYSQAMITKDIN